MLVHGDKIKIICERPFICDILDINGVLMAKRIGYETIIHPVSDYPNYEKI